MQRCTHPPAEAPHLPLSAAVIPTRLWTMPLDGPYGVFRLWTNDYARPGEARETRRRQLCVHADWTGGLADRHAVGVAGHDVPQR